MYREGCPIVFIIFFNLCCGVLGGEADTVRQLSICRASVLDWHVERTFEILKGDEDGLFNRGRNEN